MHVQLTQVLTDISGVTGLAMIRAIVAGERDPVQLARFRDRRCASSTEDIAKALTGHAQPAHGCALTQAVAWYDASTEPVREGDAEIARRFQAITPVWLDELPPLNRANTHHTHNQNAPPDDARGRRSQLTGVDLVALPGLNASPVHTMLSAIGLDLRKWPPAQAFRAWLGLAPRHAISGGRSCAGARSSPTTAPAKRSGGWRRRARLGPTSAIVATAHKLARLVSPLLTQRTPFRDRSAAASERRARGRAIAALRKQAARSGFTLVEAPAQAPDG
jgi:transposase